MDSTFGSKISIDFFFWKEYYTKSFVKLKYGRTFIILAISAWLTVDKTTDIFEEKLFNVILAHCFAEFLKFI